jgi:ethanolamine ammonia-lyase small subunit
VSLVKSAWAALRSYTPARVGLGRTGVSLPIAQHLQLQEALALARDAVREEFDAGAIAAELRAIGFDTVEVRSAATDRGTYLRRPDLGRRLAPNSRAALVSRAASPLDLALVVVDGLSAAASRRHSAAVLGALKELLPANLWTVSPVVLIHQGRVAVGDEVAEIVRARMVAVLIGERPGLSSFDSLGVYVTWAPHVGCRDGQRNCISNIRAEGLPIADAARNLAALLASARAHQLSGVALSQTLTAGAPTSAAALSGRG